MDIFEAYVRENAAYANPVYVKEPRNADSQYRHGGTIGLLKKNLWGEKSA